MTLAPIHLQLPHELPKDWKGARPRRPVMAGPGRLRKIALLGGGNSIRYAPWHDSTWELWSHASCRNKCQREPDLLFDLHPPALWRSSEKKYWDTTYYTWLKQNHLPIYMQEKYPDVPCSIRYPFETMITEFPRGYMTNTLAYMVALALMEGVTHLSVFGCDYSAASEYGAQRGGAEYWLGLAEGRGVQVLIPPTCDILGKPTLLYGYQSHPDGRRDPSYLFSINPHSLQTAVDAMKTATGDVVEAHALDLFKIDDPACPPLRNIGVPPATERRHGLPALLTKENV